MNSGVNLEGIIENRFQAQTLQVKSEFTSLCTDLF